MKTQKSTRSAEAGLTLGPSHGYRFEGDRVAVSAEITVPPGAHAGTWALELWALGSKVEPEPVHADLEKAGQRVARVSLPAVTPLRPLSHQVDLWADAHLPPRGPSYEMALVLVDADSHVRALSRYPRPEHFPAPHLSGSVGYHVAQGQVTVWAERIDNERPEHNQSGSLALELVAIADARDQKHGHTLASFELAPLGGQFHYASIERRGAFREPPAGNWLVALRLVEWTLAHGYVTRDQRVFDVPYVRTEEPALPAPAAKATPPTAPEVVAQAAPKAAEQAAPPKASTLAERLSLNGASIEELAKLPGLTQKLAKEIHKARPFERLEDLLRVKGVGQKTFDRLRSLIRL